MGQGTRCGARLTSIMQRRLRILVSNDDGYDSPALHALVRELRSFAEVEVVTPLSNMSGSSSSLSMTESVTVSIDSRRGVVVHGTPTDCVHLALVVPELIKWRPDITVSGINLGKNLGDDAMYSGTIAAAAESVQLGVPSIAFSLGSIPQRHFPPKHIEDAAKVAADLVVAFKNNLLENKGTMLNINIPDMPAKKMKGPVVRKLGMSHLMREIESLAVPGSVGHAAFAIGDDSVVDHEKDTDLEAIEKGHITVTPLNFDLTDRDKIAKVTQWLTT